LDTFLSVYLWINQNLHILKIVFSAFSCREMIKLLLFFITLLTGMYHGFGQQCKDVVYPASGSSIIFDCCIEEVRYGNMVYYLKDGRRHIIEATTIVKDGRQYKLEPYAQLPEFQDDTVVPNIAGKEKDYGNRMTHEYKYYQRKFNGAKLQANIGLVLTATGAVAGIVSIALMIEDPYYIEETVAGLYIYGFFAVNIGLPIWISGTAKKANNRRAMIRTKGTSSGTGSLNLGITRDGIGLVWRL
jgi:hypothetical protein